MNLQIINSRKLPANMASLIFALGLMLHNTCASQSLPTWRYQRFSGEATSLAEITSNHYFGKRLALSSFSFDFLGSGDHKIRRLRLSFQTHESVPDTYINSFTDDHYNKPYRYDSAAVLIGPEKLLAENSVDGDCKLDVNIGPTTPGWCVLSLPAPPENDAIFVLRSFSLSIKPGFFSTDHKIDEFGIYERDGQLWIGINDRNDDDDFHYTVEYIYLPRWLFVELDQRTGDGFGEIGLSFAPGIPVIRGFSFDFSSSDHKIDRLALDLDLDGTGAVRFDDRNDDDHYTYALDYGILPYMPSVGTGDFPIE